MPDPDATPSPNGGPGRVLTFEPARHEYRVNGVVVPSVTQLLEAAGLTVDYRGIPVATLARARARGLHVDACCDLYDEGDLDWSTVHPDAVPYVEAWAKFRVAEGYEPLAAQVQLYHPTLGYAGTADTVGRAGRRWVVVDRKATVKVASSYGCQLAGYALPGLELAERDGGLAPVPWPPPARAVVQLRPDASYRVVPYETPDDEAAFLGALALYQWRHARPSSNAPLRLDARLG
jgi:hypothetical protein